MGWHHTSCITGGMVIGFGSSEELFVLYCQLSNIYMLWLVGIRQRWNLNPYVHGNHRVAIIFIYVCVEKLSVEGIHSPRNTWLPEPVSYFVRNPSENTQLSAGQQEKLFD